METEETSCFFASVEPSVAVLRVEYLTLRGTVHSQDKVTCV